MKILEVMLSDTKKKSKQTDGADIKGAGTESSQPPVAFLSKSGLFSSFGWSELPHTYAHTRHTEETH